MLWIIGIVLSSAVVAVVLAACAAASRADETVDAWPISTGDWTHSYLHQQPSGTDMGSGSRPLARPLPSETA